MTDWQSALEAVAADYTRGTLERDARAISEAYRLKTGEGKRLLTRESEAAAYAPDPALAARAEAAHGRYRRLYAALKPLFSDEVLD